MIEFDYTRLIVETAITCLLYGIIMTFVLLVFKKGWLQEYPRAVREKYLEMHQDVKIKKNWVYILKLFLKKIIAMSIYIVTMLFVAQTAKYSDIFISENMILVPVIWLVITVFEMLVLDIGIIGHVKKIRLPGTEECSAEYRKVGKKALLDGGLGLLFGIVVYYVMFAVFMIIMTLSIKAEKALIAQYEKELEAMKASSYETAPDTYKDLVDSLVVEQEDDEVTGTDSFIGLVLNDIQDAFNENSKEDTFEEYPEYQTEDVNSSREIVRERPVLKGESLWSIAEGIYGDPYKWMEIYGQNKDIIGGDPGKIYKGQFLQIPEDNSYFYSDYETCYEDTIAETFHWEGIEPYIDPDCGYEIQNCIFYYTVPEGEGEQFKICYPKLVAHNGKDVSAVNAGIRERAMKMADQLLINRSQELSDSLLYDERYSTKWTRSSVNYVITYLDEDVISVVFQDYMFIGSIFGEDISMRTYVADINTGIRYKNEELLKNMDDLQVANLIYEDMLLQHADSEYDTMIFEEVLTPQLMAEALQTNGDIDGRYFMNTFLTQDGVGFSFSYRVGQEIDGSYSIMRGWTKTILSKEQVLAHMTDAPVWGDWLK